MAQGVVRDIILYIEQLPSLTKLISTSIIAIVLEILLN